MRSPRLNTLIIATIAAVLATASLAGCSSSKGKGSPSSSSHGSTSSSPPLTQNTLPAASSIVNDLVKRKAIVVTKCAASDDGWQASGTAANTGTADASYAITIFFTNAHATVEDFATAAVTVKPGQTQTWTAAKKFTASNPTNCVLRGVG